MSCSGRSQRGPKIFRVRLLCGICTILILIGHGLWRGIISLIVRVYSYQPLHYLRQNLSCTFSKKNCCKRIIGCYVGTNKAGHLYERINPPEIGLGICFIICYYGSQSQIVTQSINELKKIFIRLHSSDGCMWDRKQTHQSILADLKEEVREFIAAVHSKDPQHMQEEIGDILLHVMFQSQIASKEGLFSIEEVIDGLIKKIKRRHPHVFGTAKVKSAAEIIRNWNRINRQEKKRASLQKNT